MHWGRVLEDIEEISNSLLLLIILSKKQKFTHKYIHPIPLKKMLSQKN